MKYYALIYITFYKHPVTTVPEKKKIVWESGCFMRSSSTIFLQTQKNRRWGSIKLKPRTIPQRMITTRVCFLTINLRENFWSFHPNCPNLELFFSVEHDLFLYAPLTKINNKPDALRHHNLGTSVERSIIFCLVYLAFLLNSFYGTRL